MKKIICLFVILGALSAIAQAKKETVSTKPATATVKGNEKKLFISKDDIIFKQGKTFLAFDDIYLEDADKNSYPVSLTLLVKEAEFKSTGITNAKLNSMIITAYYNALYSCKNKSTFRAKNITIFYYDKYDAWSLDVKFTAQNEYEAVKEGTYTTYYERTGTTEATLSTLVKKQ